MELFSLDIPSWIAPATSVIALCVSYRSFRNSSRALKMSEMDFAERRFSIHSNLVEAYKEKRGDESYASFLLTFTNKASVSQTIVKLELELHYVTSDGESHVVKLRHDTASGTRIAGKDLKMLAEPIELSAKSAATGWASFKLIDRIYRKARIERYRVVGTLHDGGLVSVEKFILSEVQT